jgi:bile acid-coenzyme A ligase
VVVAGEMTVLDDDGRECGPGEPGEIYMRPAPGARRTYRYIGSTATARDGWETLGDLGYYRDFPDGRYFYLNDRRVDMFTVGGRNVYPAEIESALAEHPQVLSSLVVGVPDADLGQVPHALVQPAVDGPALDEAGVRTFLGERIASYKVPRSVEFTDRPLRDDAGKVRRSAVRAEVLARRAAQSG